MIPDSDMRRIRTNLTTATRTRTRSSVECPRHGPGGGRGGADGDTFAPTVGGESWREAYARDVGALVRELDELRRMARRVIE